MASNTAPVAMFISVEITDAVRSDTEIAKKLTEVCPVNIFAVAPDGACDIVESNSTSASSASSASKPHPRRRQGPQALQRRNVTAVACLSAHYRSRLHGLALRAESIFPHS